jgi:hypothetical protein
MGQRERQITERVRSVCAHNGFNNEDVHRLVHLEYRASSTREGAVRAVVDFCRGVGGVEERNALARAVSK